MTYITDPALVGELNDKVAAQIASQKPNTTPVSEGVNAALEQGLVTQMSPFIDTDHSSKVIGPTVGVGEMVLSMASGLAASLPAIGFGTHAALTQEEVSAEAQRNLVGASEIESPYFDAYHSTMEAGTYSPRSVYGEKYEAVMMEAYYTWIEKKWRDEFVGGRVDRGEVTPRDASAEAIVPDAIMMFLPFKAAAITRYIKNRRLGATPEEALSGEWIPKDKPPPKGGMPAKKTGVTVEMEKGGYPAKWMPPLRVAVDRLLEKGYPIEEIVKRSEAAGTPELAVQALNDLRLEAAAKTKSSAEWIAENGRALEPSDLIVTSTGKWSSLVRIRETGDQLIMATRELQEVLSKTPVPAVVPHIQNGQAHFGSLNAYNAALGAEVAKWEVASRRNLNKLSENEIWVDYRAHLPNWVQNKKGMVNLIMNEKPSVIASLRERMYQVSEHLKSTGGDLKGPARPKLFKPRNAQQKFFRNMNDAQLAEIRKTVDYNSELMRWTAAEMAPRMTINAARDLAKKLNLSPKGNKRVVLQRIKDNARAINEGIEREISARHKADSDVVKPRATEKGKPLEGADARMAAADFIAENPAADIALSSMPMKVLREVAKELKAPAAKNKKDLAKNIMDTAEGIRQTPGYMERIARLRNESKMDYQTTLAKIFPKQAGILDMGVIYDGIKAILSTPYRGAKAAFNLAHLISRGIAMKHVTELRRLNSHTAKMLAERIFASDTPVGKPQGWAEKVAFQHIPKIQRQRGFHEAVRIKQAEFSTRADNILERHRRSLAGYFSKDALTTLRWSALPEKVQYQIRAALERGEAVPKNLEPVVRDLKILFDDIFVYLAEAGVFLSDATLTRLKTDMGAGWKNYGMKREAILREAKEAGSYRSDFFPHMWDEPKVRRNMDGFKEYLRDLENIDDPLTVAEVTHKIAMDEGFMEFVEDVGGRLRPDQAYHEWRRTAGVEGHASKASFEMARKLDGRSKTAIAFQVTDIEAVLNAYIHRAAIRAEYTRIAGRGEHKLNRMVKDIIEEDTFNNHMSGKLQTRSATAIAKDVYDLFDAMQNRYGQIKNPSLRGAARGASGFTVLAQLGLVSLAQLPEFMVPALRYRVATSSKSLRGTPLEGLKIPGKSYVKGTAAMGQDLASWVSGIPTGRRIIPEPLLKKHLQAVGATGMAALESAGSRFVGPTGPLTARGLKIYLMDFVTNWQRYIAMDTIQSMVFDNARMLAGGAKGKKGRQLRRELQGLGIESDAAIQWYKDGAPKNHPFNYAYQTAQSRGLMRSILDPQTANVPKWLNNQHMQLVFLFSRFYSTFGNTVLKPVVKDLMSRDVTAARKAGIFGSIAAMMGIAYYMQMFVREPVSGYQVRDIDDPMRVIDAADRAGLTGAFARFYSIFSPYKYSSDVRFTAALLGPFYGGVVPDAVGFVQAFGSGDSKTAARKLAKNIPFVTISGEGQETVEEILEEIISDTQDFVGID